MKQRPDDPQAETRREIMRRASLYTTSFLAAALGIAVVGAAFVAWLLSLIGMPFLSTWLIAVVIVVLPGLTAAIWNLIRGR
ncbi:hypothetical protein BH23GEM10_BH23GEM10_05850 [soil metagenome]